MAGETVTLIGTVTSPVIGFTGQFTDLASGPQSFRMESAWAGQPAGQCIEDDLDGNGYCHDFDGNNWATYVEYDPINRFQISGDLILDVSKIGGVPTGDTNHDRNSEFLAFDVEPGTDSGYLNWDQTSNGSNEHVIAIDDIDVQVVTGGFCADMSGLATSSSRQDDVLNIRVCDRETASGGDSYENYWTEMQGAGAPIDEALWEYTILTGDVLIQLQ